MYLLLSVLKDGKSKVKMPADPVSMRALSLAYRRLPHPCPQMIHSGLSPSSYKDTNPHMKAPSSQLHLNLITSQAHICKSLKRQLGHVECIRYLCENTHVYTYQKMNLSLRIHQKATWQENSPCPCAKAWILPNFLELQRHFSSLHPGISSTEARGVIWSGLCIQIAPFLIRKLFFLSPSVGNYSGLQNSVCEPQRM